MPESWNAERVLAAAWAFQPSCVLAAGAELGLFDALARAPATAKVLARRLGTDARATAVLADALAALGLLAKGRGRYRLAPGVGELLAESSPHSLAGMLGHQASCLRGWARLADVVRTGRPVRRPGRRDGAGFADAMDRCARLEAPRLRKALGRIRFRKLLDVGGGSGAWTIALLRSAPGATAILLDRPSVIRIARRRIRNAGLADRVTCVSGDFHADAALPPGADLAWVSSVVHMNSRRANRRLFAKVHAALVGGGRILIHDVVMDRSRTAPLLGAMFAVNMLVHTPKGGTYTFAELKEDLVAAGFRRPIRVPGEMRYAVIRASKGRSK
jgi:SAM-dependent methyltransferase